MRKATFDEALDKEYHYFLHLKRLFLLQMKVLETCDGRPIKNDLVYQQMLFASIDGLFVRLDKFHVRLVEFLNVLKVHHLDHFKRNNKKAFAVDSNKVNCINGPDPDGQKLVARELTKRFESNFNEVYARVFPGVIQRNAGRPNHSDFDRLIRALRDAFVPIRKHRDTVVAHWDQVQEPATVEELRTAVDHVQQLLKDLFYISKLASVIFELGGIAADVKRTAKELGELILGSHRARLAKPADMDTVYMMGFDAWAGGLSKEKYLEVCRSSPKYAKGTWHVLENNEGTPVSSLITYELEPVEGKPSVGIGSIATEPVLRKQGHAGHLLWEVLRVCQDRNGSRCFFLHSDIAPRCYQGFGFEPLPEKYQKKPGTTAMIRCSKEIKDRLFEDPTFKPPIYF